MAQEDQGLVSAELCKLIIRDSFPIEDVTDLLLRKLKVITVNYKRV